MAGPSGWPSIFRDDMPGLAKVQRIRVQGVLTRYATVVFEQARRNLAKLAKSDVRLVSDRDVIEYLARGDKDTKQYLERKRDK